MSSSTIPASLVRRLPAAAAATAAVVSAVALSTPAIAADATIPAGPAASTPRTTVVASGLDAPKYLNLQRDGLYVAESGHGGTDCLPVVGTTEQPTTDCTGPSGAVLRVDGHGRVRTVLRGLASTTEQDNGEQSGPMAVTFVHGRPVVLMRGVLTDAAGGSSIDGRLGREYGKLLVGDPCRGLRTVTDLGRFAATHPQSAATMGGLPGETTYDSDGHDVVPYRGGFVFADAGANDVLWQHASGEVTVLARIPTRTETAPAGFFGPGSPAMQVQAQSVPSSVRVGPDGAVYVGILRGQPALPGTASVFRVTPGNAPAEVVTGLTRVNDIAFDRQGRMLVLEQRTGADPTSPGALLRATLDPNGAAVQAQPLPVTGLVDPTGLAVDQLGSVYVTDHTNDPGTGRVLRISGLN